MKGFCYRSQVKFILDMNSTATYIVGISLGVFYIYYTLNYTLKFRKNVIFKGWVRIFHYIMFWIIPFVWISFIKTLSQSAKGSHEFENKADAESFGTPYTGA